LSQISKRRDEREREVRRAEWREGEKGREGVRVLYQ